MKNRIFRRPAANEEGFVLVLSLVLLLLLTLFGVWALNSSDFENRVAGNAQQAERQFHVAEAANYSEAALLGYTQRDVYDLTFPDDHNRVLAPVQDFDPFNKKDCNKSDVNEKYNSCYAAKPDDPTTWPWDNLEGKHGADRNKFLDYRYLVTYLYSDKPPKGYAADQFDSYKYRIQGNAPRTVFGVSNPGRMVETAGGKVRNRTNI